MNRFIKSTWAAATMLAISAIPAFAQTSRIDLSPPKVNKWENLGSLTPGTLVSSLIRLSLIVASVVFFFMLVIGGIKWIMSGGDKGKTEEARNQITAALVGLVIVFSAWAITKLIETLFNVNILDLDAALKG